MGIFETQHFCVYFCAIESDMVGKLSGRNWRLSFMCV